MTLIAGFRSYDTPFLIGDFLLTSNTLGRSGLRKKILLIADNFALAWTGDLFAAEVVIKTLQSRLDLSGVTLENVRAVLTKSPLHLGVFHVVIICWIVDHEGQHCFRWRSDYPKEFFVGCPMYDGSGEEVIEAIAGPKGLHDSSGNSNVNPVVAALQVTTNLMKAEIFGPSTETFGFGFAYELLYLVDGFKFEYVDNVSYTGITYELDENGHYIGSSFSGAYYKYQSYGNLTAIFIYDPIARSQERHVITPTGFSRNNARTNCSTRS